MTPDDDTFTEDVYEREYVQDLDETGEEDTERECSDSCPHYDSLNQCCWQATKKGLCFTVHEGDYCHLGYMENDGR